MTPVTDTYIHAGNVLLAIRLCSTYLPRSPRDSVEMAIGRIAAARMTCEIRMAKYT